MSHTANGVAYLLEERYPEDFIRCVPRACGGGTLIRNGLIATYNRDELEDLYSWLLQTEVKEKVKEDE